MPSPGRQETVCSGPDYYRPDRSGTVTVVAVLDCRDPQRCLTAGRGSLAEREVTPITQEPPSAASGPLDPEVVALMLERARRGDSALRELTERQHDVLALMAEGRNNAAIARQLTITEKAVVQHTSHIYDVLGLAPGTDDHRRVLAVLRYLSR